MQQSHELKRQIVQNNRNHRNAWQSVCCTPPRYDQQKKKQFALLSLSLSLSKMLTKRPCTEVYTNHPRTKTIMYVHARIKQTPRPATGRKTIDQSEHSTRGATSPKVSDKGFMKPLEPKCSAAHMYNDKNRFHPLNRKGVSNDAYTSGRSMRKARSNGKMYPWITW